MVAAAAVAAAAPKLTPFHGGAAICAARRRCSAMLRRLLRHRLLHGGMVDLPCRLDRRACALDRLLVILGLQELLRLEHLGLGGGRIDHETHGGIAPGLLDGPTRLIDLGLGLSGQTDVLAGQLFGAVQVGGGAAQLFEQTGRRTAGSESWSPIRSSASAAA